jgi:hypothetical protein
MLNYSTALGCQQEKKQEKIKSIKISGIVTDEQGNRLNGVTILFVKKSESESQLGVVIRDNGKYQIVCESNRSLIFSLNGYESQKIDIMNRDEIDIVMKKTINK